MYVQSTISKFRNEEIMAYKKSFKHQTVIRRFGRERSVFRLWIPDDKSEYPLMNTTVK